MVNNFNQAGFIHKHIMFSGTTSVLWFICEPPCLFFDLQVIFKNRCSEEKNTFNSISEVCS